MMKSRRSRQIGLSRRRMLVFALLGVLLTGIIGVGVYFFGRQAEMKALVAQDQRGDLTNRFQEPRIVTYQGHQYRYRSDLSTVLFIGVDRTEEQMDGISGYRNGGQSDFLLLQVIDSKNKTITPIQIDRDTMTEITVLGVLGNVSGTRNAQICLSHGFGDGKEQSCLFSVDAVSKYLLGVDINFYIATNLSEIAPLNDALGGVTVTLEDDFSALDPTMTKGTTLTLQGKQAEFFVRNRMNIGIGTNESRMVRQQDYMAKITAMIGAKLHEDPGFVGTMFDSMKAQLITNMPRGRMINVAYGGRDYQRNATISPAGEHTIGNDGFVEFHTDQEALEAMVIHTFFEPVGETQQ